MHDAAQRGRRLAIDQGGVVRREQLYELGMPRRTLHRRIAQGEWQQVGKNVLLLPGTADTLLTRSLVASHSAYPDGVLTGWSALAAEGLLGERPWDALTPEPQPWIRLTQHRRLGARVIRVAAHGRSRRARGVLLAPFEVVMTDLLRLLPGEDARRLSFRIAQTMGSARLLAFINSASHHLRTAPGSQQLRALAAALATGAHSDAEEEIVRLLVEAGFTGFQVNHPVRAGGRVYRLDVALVEERLAIEVDGRAFHTDAHRFQHDRTRQNALIAAGWRVLRFTWEDLTQRPEQVLTEIARMLGR